MSKTQKENHTAFAIILAIALPLTAFGFIAILACLCLGLFPTSQSIRNKMCDYYNNPSNYETVYGKAQILFYDRQTILINVTIDEGYLQDNPNGSNLKPNQIYQYEFIESNSKIITDNGIEEAFGITTVNDYGVKVTEITQTVSVIVTNAIWWDGGTPFAVGLSIGDKDYLEADTGKGNLINYIKYEMY